MCVGARMGVEHIPTDKDAAGRSYSVNSSEWEAETLSLQLQLRLPPRLQ